MNARKGMKPQEKEALEILSKAFGQQHGEYLLWNETCFPFDAEITLLQARELVKILESVTP